MLDNKQFSRTIRKTISSISNYALGKYGVPCKTIYNNRFTEHYTNINLFSEKDGYHNFFVFKINVLPVYFQSSGNVWIFTTQIKEEKYINTKLNVCVGLYALS